MIADLNPLLRRGADERRPTSGTLLITATGPSGLCHRPIRQAVSGTHKEPITAIKIANQKHKTAVSWREIIVYDLFKAETS
jgi:hypothetical protein